jgi:hypothetical protein
MQVDHEHAARGCFPLTFLASLTSLSPFCQPLKYPRPTQRGTTMATPSANPSSPPPDLLCHTPKRLRQKSNLASSPFVASSPRVASWFSSRMVSLFPLPHRRHPATAPIDVAQTVSITVDVASKKHDNVNHRFVLHQPRRVSIATR